MFTVNLSRRRVSSVLAACLIVMLVLPYARAATCDCHDHAAESGHCANHDASALTDVSMEDRCDAMMACCLIDFGPVLIPNISVSEWSFRDAMDAVSPRTISAILQAPPKPPPKA